MATPFTGNMMVKNLRTGATVAVPLNASDVANALCTFQNAVSTETVLSGDPLAIVDMTFGAAATVVNFEVYVGGQMVAKHSFASCLTTAIGRPLVTAPIGIGAGKSVSIKQTA